VVAAALLGAAALAAVVVVLISGGTATRKPAQATAKSGASGHTGGAAPAAHVVGSPIKVGNEPTGIDGNSSVLWVANFGVNTVTRVTLNGKIRTDIALQPKPFAVLNTGHAFWVSSAAAGTVTPISSATGLPGKPVRVGNKPEWMAGDENAVYVSNAASDSVSVINPRTDKLIGPPINVGAVPRGIALSGSAVWVADSDNDRIDRIVDGQIIKRIPVGHRPIGVAFGDNAVWVANENDSTVSRIDLTQDSVKTIKVGRAPFAIAFGLGSAWVTNSLDDTVTRLDAATGQPVGSPIAVGQDPTGIVVINQSVWVTNRRSNTVQQIQP
jgi:YVTN family beta-propeller protein